MTSVSLHGARGFRMRRQHLIERSPAGTMLQAIEAVHGIQAQISAHAVFAVAQRVEKSTPAEIDQALWADRSLIKTWAMRGTVHWLPATEEPIFVAAMSVIRGPYILRWWEGAGVSQAQVEHLYAAVQGALSAGPMTRQEVAAAVVPTVGDWVEPWLLSSWGSGFKRMCQAGLIVFGPTRGTNVTFAWRDSWTGHPVTLEGGAGLIELMRRYVRSFGPVTLQDTAYWLGASIRDILPHWNRLLAELEPVECAGSTRWVMANDLDELIAMEQATLPVRLVPAFDPLLLAHRDKSQILDMQFYKRIYGAAAWVYPSVLVNGAIAGAWSYEKKAKVLNIKVEPFQKITKLARKAIEREANHLASVSGRTAVVTYQE